MGMKSRFAALSTLSLASVLLFACSGSSETNIDKGFAVPPTEEMVRAEPKGLSVSDSLALPPNPAPDVDLAPANQKPDTDTRLANLEAAVAALRADYDTIVPTFKTLSVNTDRLVGLMDRLEGKRNMPSLNLLSPAAGSDLKTPTLDAETVIQSVRFGRHDEKTRIVLDVTNLSQYSYEIDNAEGIMVISMPYAVWEAGAQEHSIGSGLVEGWTHQHDEVGGTALVLQLKETAKVVHKNSLPASGDRGSRIFVDIAPL